MSEMSQGPGWWQASDGRWYPPELHPDRGGQGPPQQSMSLLSPAGTPEEALSSWAPTLAQPADASLPQMATAYQGAGGYPPSPGYGTPPAGHHPPQHPPVATGSSGGRFTRGLRLVGVGFAMARDEPGLMMVPVVAFLVQLVILALAAAALYPALHASGTAEGGTGTVHFSVAQWAVVVVAGLVTMFVSVVSHATIIARVMARFHGQGVSNTQAARAALTKSPQLLAWAFVNYVVIAILRGIGNRGILGAIVGWVLRAGWMLASFFVVPVILFENKGALASIKRSVELCRSRWGENIVGNGALGVIGTLAVLLDVAVAVLLGTVFAPLGAAVGLIGLIAILLVLTVASGAFNAALYWFAVTEQAPGHYSLGDLQSAYRQKARKSGAFGL